MNVLKNFEALFIVTLGLACAANYVLDSDADTAAQPQVASVQAAAPAYAAAKDMQVVVVSAKRMTAEQKVQSLIDERKTDTASVAASGSKM